MELRQIKYFQEICLSGSVTQAAKNLSLTQPALTQQIQLLERELGVDLFARSNRGIQLTAAGEIFAARAHEIMQKIHDLADAVKPAERVPQVTFASGETLATHFVPHLVVALRERFPGMRIRVVESDLTEIQSALKNDSVDFALSPEPIGDANYINRYLLEDRIIAVVAASDALAQKKNIEWLDLVEHDWVLFDKGSAIRKFGDRAFYELSKRFQPRIAMELRSLSGVVSCIEAGLGIGFISELSLTNKLARLSLSALERKRKFYLTHKKNRTALKAVSDVILSLAAERLL